MGRRADIVMKSCGCGGGCDVVRVVRRADMCCCLGCCAVQPRSAVGLFNSNNASENKCSDMIPTYNNI